MQAGLTTARRVARRMRRLRRPRVGHVRFGHLRRTTPLSRHFGFDRGQPIDRYYIERFLRENELDIRGRVLEVGDDTYTRAFGSNRVTQRDILHVDDSNPFATIVADLSHAPHINDDQFDCIILTQTLHLIFDLSAAISTLHRILQPGGVLLMTVPGITPLSSDRWNTNWFWSFTDQAVTRLFSQAFPSGSVTVQTYGNVLVASAFLYGLSMEELKLPELEYHDPRYQLLITMRAQKPGKS